MKTLRECLKDLPEPVLQNYIDAIIKQYGVSEMLDETAAYTALLIMSIEADADLTPAFIIRSTLDWSKAKLGSEYWATVYSRLELDLPLI
jgi:hypothetical protein